MIWLLIIAALVVFYLVILYNRLVTLRQRVRESWSDIDTQLKRRYDLIPNLVETVKGYAKHEKETLENVVKARSAAMETQGHGEDKAAKENMLTDALKSVFALSEAYPDLKANQNYLEMMQELTDTENKIQASRRFYNSNVMAMNTQIEAFPSNLIASHFKFEKEPFFELTEEEKKQVAKAPKVSF